MALSFSLSNFVNYMNDQAANKETALSQAFRKDVKAAIALAGYPTKDEIDIIDTIEGIKMTNTAGQIQNTVASYMKDQGRTFVIPSTDENTCELVIGRKPVEDKIKEGVSVIGGDEKPWKCRIKAHTEYFAKNKRKPFTEQL